MCFFFLSCLIDGISLGGPSPMYGGLLHSVAAAQTAPCKYRDNCFDFV